MIGPAIRATPWLLPGTAGVLLVAGLLHRRLARRLSISRWLAFFLLVALGLIVVVSLTPSLDGGFWGRRRVASFGLSLEPFRRLTSINEASLNVALFVPLAWAIQMIRQRRPRNVLSLAVLALPLAIELVQYALPVLGRSGFQMNDVVANLFGAVLGLGLGTLARLSLLRLRRRDTRSAATNPRLWQECCGRIADEDSGEWPGVFRIAKHEEGHESTQQAYCCHYY